MTGSRPRSVRVSVDGGDGTEREVAVTVAGEASGVDVEGAVLSRLQRQGVVVNRRTRRTLADAETLGDADVLEGDSLVIRQDRPEPRRPTLDGIGGPANGISIEIGDRTEIGRLASKIVDEQMSRRHAALARSGGGYSIEDLGSANGTKLNGVQVSSAHPIRTGDRVQLGDSIFRFDAGDDAPADLPVGGHIEPRGGRLAFNVSPGSYRRRESPRFKAPQPPRARAPRRVPWPMLITGALGGVAMALVIGNPRFLAMTAISVIGGLWNWIEDRRSGRADHGRSVAAFERGLAQLDAELAQAHQDEAEHRRRLMPPIEQLLRDIDTLSHRLWDRSVARDGHLLVQVGTGDHETTLDVAVPDDAEPPQARKLAELVERYSLDRDAPIGFDFLEHPVVGIVGDQATRRDVARAILLQLAGRYSVAELGLVVCAPRAAASWRDLRWFPHLEGLEGIGGRAFAPDDARAEALATALVALAEKRTSDRAEDRWSAAQQRFVCTVFEPPFQLSESAVAGVLTRAAKARMGAIWLADARSQLPRQCDLVLDLVDGELQIVDLRAETTSAPLSPVRLDLARAARAARQLAPLDDPTDAGSSSGLPPYVDLVDLLPEGMPTAATVLDRWRNPDGRLAAVIGTTAEGPLEIDFAATPHALVAGTTGAGKSELLQTMLASLIHRYSPRDLNLLFVDYKGGAAFKQFRDAPHCVGMVTNLDAGVAARAVTALKAEVHRRQTEIDRHDAKDVVHLRSKSPVHALPELLIVCDEFASIVKNVEGFIDAVVEIAERGRSLGVHVVLATQTPSKAVSPAIQNCADLRISMRLKNQAESQLVIDDQAAADLPAIAGRGIVRTPDSYGEFQAAYVGNRHDETAAHNVVVSVVDDAGTVTDRAGATHVSRDLPTDLERFVSATQAAFQGQEPLRRPWLPPLPVVLPVADLPPGGGGELVLGMLDEPARQEQRPYVVTAAGTPNLSVIGGAASGKTTFLRTVAGALAASAASDALWIYGIDLASGGLSSLTDLPHCGGICSTTNPASLRRLLGILHGLADARRVHMERERVSSFDDLRRSTSEPMARVYVLVDGAAALRQLLDDLDARRHRDAFDRLVSQGPSLGIHFVLATDQPEQLPTAWRNAVQETVVLPRNMTDDSLRLLAVPVQVSAVPGRGVSLGQASELQVAVHAEGGSTDSAAQAAALAALARRLRAEDDGGTVESVGGVDRVTPATVGVASGAAVHIGIDDISHRTVGVDFSRIPTLLVVGPAGSGRTSVAGWTRRSLADAGTLGAATLLCGGRQPTLDGFDTVACGLEASAAALEAVEADVERRLVDGAHDWHLLVLDDCDDLVDAVVSGLAPDEAKLRQAALGHLDTITRHAADAQVAVVATGRLSRLLHGAPWVGRMRSGGQGLLLAPNQLGVPYPPLDVTLPRRDDWVPSPGRGVLIRAGVATVVQVVDPSPVSG